MLLVKVGRNELVQAVNEGKIDRGPAPVLLREAVMVAVEPVAAGEIGIAHHLAPEDLAIFQGGNPGLVEPGQEKAVGSRGDLQLRREPADTELLLQQRINAVKRAARFAAKNDYAVVVRPQREAFRAHLFGLELQARFLKMRVVAEQNLPRAWGLGICDNWQLRAAEFFQIPLQFLGGITLGSGRISCDDDAVGTFALGGEGEGGRSWVEAGDQQQGSDYPDPRF